MVDLTPEQAWKRAAEIVGMTRIARALKIARSSVAGWSRVPPQHVLTVERLVDEIVAKRVDRHQLRPDIYPKENLSGAA